MSSRSPVRGRFTMVLACGLVLTVAGTRSTPVRAYDPATTHAGLTERAAVASTLNKILSRRLGKPLGLFEPITLDVRQLDGNEARYLMTRLGTLDPGQGYRPGDDGVATALSWIVAGSVIAGIPAERAQNTFYDPSHKNGLNQDGGAAEAMLSLRLLMDAGGSPRSIATGTDFNLHGQTSLKWLVSPDNDVGLAAFYDQLDRSVSSPAAATRATALARALMALGGTLAVLEDAGEPAHVRNDFRGAYQDLGGPSPFDRGSSFERHVAEAYGRAGVPAPGPAVERPDVFAFITAADAQGLADRTQRRFFSSGTLPGDAIVDGDTTTQDVLRQARDSAPFGLPRITRLELREQGQAHYLMAHDEGGPARRLLGYERVSGRVRFFMDGRVFEDTARVLLPEIGGYAVGLIEHLFRAQLALEVQDGQPGVRLSGLRGPLRGGKLRVFSETAAGERRELTAAGMGPALETVLGSPIPPGTRRLAVVLRGEDDAGPFVAASELRLP